MSRKKKVKQISKNQTHSIRSLPNNILETDKKKPPYFFYIFFLSNDTFFVYESHEHVYLVRLAVLYIFSTCLAVTVGTRDGWQALMQINIYVHIAKHISRTLTSLLSYHI